MDSLQQHLDKLLRDEQVELAVTCASSVLGIRAGLTPNQQSLFNTPWGKAPESEEEQFHQDLVWVYKVLPTNDKFNPDIAVKVVYKEMRLKALDDFWSNYDPEDYELERQQTYKKHLPKKNNNPRKLVINQPTFRCIGTENIC